MEEYDEWRDDGTDTVKGYGYLEFDSFDSKKKDFVFICKTEGFVPIVGNKFWNVQQYYFLITRVGLIGASRYIQGSLYAVHGKENIMQINFFFIDWITKTVEITYY